MKGNRKFHSIERKLSSSFRTIVPWEEFKDKLQQNHSDLTPDETIALQNTMDLTNNNHISIFEFDVFTRYERIDRSIGE